MRTLKRLFALLLVLVMCLSLMPTYAFAEEEDAVLEDCECEEHECTDQEEIPVETEAASEEVVEESEEALTEEPAEELITEPAEEPEVETEDEQTEESESEPQPVRVTFVCDPEDLVLTVWEKSAKDTETEEQPAEPIEPEADGTYLLLPGEYVYDAECIGYITAENVELSINDEDSERMVEISLAKEIVEDEEAQLVRVKFVCDPADLTLEVYTLDEVEERVIYEPEEDGTYLLLPGVYYYDASCEGFITYTDAFTPTESNITVEILLFKNENSSFSANFLSLENGSSESSALANVAKNYVGCKLYDFPNEYRINNDWCCWFVSFCAYHAGLSCSAGRSTDNLFPAFSASNSGDTGAQTDLKWAATNQVRFANWMSYNNKGVVYYFNLTNGNGCSISTNKNWVQVAKSSFTPQPGDLFIENNYGHIGIIEKYDSANDRVYLYAGNESGSSYTDSVVHYRSCNYTNWAVNAIVRPNYGYLSKCTPYPSYGTVSVTAATTVKTLPCSAGTDSSSANVETLSKGVKLTVCGLYKNTVGNYWYKVLKNNTSGKTYSEAYVFAGDTSWQGAVSSGCYGVYVSGTTKPNSINQGSTYPVTGSVNSSYNQLTAAGVQIYPGLATSGTASTGYIATGLNTKSFSLSGTVDSNTKYDTLAVGSYTYTVKASIKGYYSNNGTSTSTYTADVIPEMASFTVVSAGTHVHNKGTYMFYEEDHPHCKCYKCSVCGTIWRNENETVQLPDCEQCRPEKPIFIGLEGLHSAAEPVTFNWSSAARTTHYNLWVYKKNESGEYTATAHTFYVDIGFQLSLEPGEYRALLQAYNSDLWESDNSDWVHTESDLTYFTVAKPNYTVTYNANGGSGAPSAQTKTYGTALTLSSTKPSRTGYTFQGWATGSTAASAQYQPGDKYVTEGDVTLYAVWKPNEYQITFDANGGSGAPGSQIKYYGTTLTLSAVRPTRPCHVFVGWASSKTATTAQYQPGGSYTANAGTVLYAVWAEGTQSEWSTTKPTGVADSLIETKTQYRYADKETTTSSQSALSGWTLYDTKSSWGEYGAWSDWSTTSVAGSDSTEVQTRTAYQYYYYQCPRCGTHMHGYGTGACYTWAGGCGASISGDSYTRVYTTNPYSNTSDWHGTGVRNYYDSTYANLFAYTSTSSQYYAAPVTQYMYRTRTLDYTYYYYRWKEWSEWGDTVYTASDSRKVETRTLYRYAISGDVHSWDSGSVTTPATHTTEGVKEYTCTECGATKTETIGKLTTHTFNKQIVADKYKASNATCTEKAKYYYSCECGAKGTTTFESGSALGHVSVADPAKAPTCTESGLTAGSHCSRCGATLTAQKTVPATGHSYATAWSHDDTYHWHIATCEHTSEVSGKATHNWDDGVVTTAAQVGKTGVMTFTCTVCKATKTETIPALTNNTYTVTYNANGGTGAPADQVKEQGKTLTLSSTKPTRDGYIFKGWSTSSTATTAQYQAGGRYSSNASVTLYAVWEKDTSADAPKMDFIERLYQVCLGRSASSDEMAYYIWLLNDQGETGVSVAYKFVFADEFKAKNYCDKHYVIALYEAFMGREPSADEISNWTWRLQQGDRREDVFNQFALSKEFGDICEDAGITQGSAISVYGGGTKQGGYCTVSGCTSKNKIVEFATRLYTVCLDRAPGQSEIDAWHYNLVHGDYTATTSSEYFIFSLEFTGKDYSDEEYTKHLYDAMMGRNGRYTADELAYWCWMLRDQGLTREQMFDQFAASDEFKAICQQYGVIHS